MKFTTLFFALLLLPNVIFSAPEKSPPIILAEVYEKGLDISQYWISEKYDGVRAYWDGKQFLSRSGIEYSAPGWFTAGFPKFPLDGELWIGRNQFQQLVSTVRKDHPIDKEWRKVSYQVFELPGGSGTFSQRLSTLRNHFKSINNPHIQLASQFRIENHEVLTQRLNQIVSAGGEGLMLHRADALYKTGRSDDLLKLKLYQDAEATVIKQFPGKGKYTGLMGSLLVEIEKGITFRIGSGFSDSERRNPPPIGAIITYKYYGLTNKGIPRFASFLRVRSLVKNIVEKTTTGKTPASAEERQ